MSQHSIKNKTSWRYRIVYLLRPTPLTVTKISIKFNEPDSTRIAIFRNQRTREPSISVTVCNYRTNNLIEHVIFDDSAKSSSSIQNHWHGNLLTPFSIFTLPQQKRQQNATWQRSITFRVVRESRTRSEHLDGGECHWTSIKRSYREELRRKSMKCEELTYHTSLFLLFWSQGNPKPWRRKREGIVNGVGINFKLSPV